MNLELSDVVIGDPTVCELNERWEALISQKGTSGRRELTLSLTALGGDKKRRRGRRRKALLELPLEKPLLGFGPRTYALRMRRSTN